MEIAVVFWVEEWNDPSGVLGRRLSWVGRSSGLFAPHTKEGPEGERGQDTESEHTEDERLWKMFVEWYSLLPDWRGRETEGRIQYNSNIRLVKNGANSEIHTKMTWKVRNVPNNADDTFTQTTWPLLWSCFFNSILNLRFLSMSDGNEVSTLIIKEASFLLCTLNQRLSQWFYTGVLFLEYTGKLGICLLFTISNLAWNVLWGLWAETVPSWPIHSYAIVTCMPAAFKVYNFGFGKLILMKRAYWKCM